MPNCDDSPYIELMFDTPQEKLATGWTIEPHIKPCSVSLMFKYLHVLMLITIAISR